MTIDKECISSQHWYLVHDFELIHVSSHIRVNVTAIITNYVMPQYNLTVRQFQCSLPATVLTTLGWITFVVGFGWLNQQHSYLLPQGSTHTGRWELAGFYILAVCPPIYFIVYFVYMLTGQWAVGILVSLFLKRIYYYIHASMNDVDNIHTLSMSLLLYVV